MMLRLGPLTRRVAANACRMHATLPVYRSDPLQPPSSSSSSKSSQTSSSSNTSTNNSQSNTNTFDDEDPKPNYDFKSHFEYSKPSSEAFTPRSLYNIREGMYIDIPQTDVEKYFPEGLAGDSKEEFEYSQRNSWMMRDVTKLLCRLVDEFSPSSASTPSTSSMSSAPPSKQSVISPIVVPELTDKPEWLKSTLRVKRFGSELPYTKPINESGLTIVNGPGSLVQEYYSALSTNPNYATPNKVMLTGDRGVGKSFALNQLVYYTRSNKSNEWIVLFIPNGWKHVQGGMYVEPLSDPIHGEMYDNKIMSVELLRGLWRAHSKQLATIPLNSTSTAESVVNIDVSKYTAYLEQFGETFNREVSMPGRSKFNFIKVRSLIEGEDNLPIEDALDEDVLLNWNYKKSSSSISNLEELIQLGVAFRDLAGLVVIDLITRLESVTEYKVLIAVDQYNSWLAKSAYMYDNKHVYGTDIVVPKMLSYLSRKKAQSESRNLSNGLFICSESLKHPEGAHDLFNAASNSVPLTIIVPHYNQVEFLSALLYYTNQQCINEGISNQDLLAYRMFVNSNPRICRLEGCTFFMRISMSSIEGDFMMLEAGQGGKLYSDEDGLDDEESLDGGYDDVK